MNTDARLEAGPELGVVVLGAGYAGMLAAIRIARRNRRRGVKVTLVNPTATFTERLRMHQAAAGQRLATYRITDVIAGTGVSFVAGWATQIDAEHRHVLVATDDGERHLAYDWLVCATGSVTDTASVPGADRHAYTLDGAASAAKLAARLAALPAGGTVTVCGNGLTGIEAATEIAEAHPQLHVLIIGRGPTAAMMGPRARAYLHTALARLGVATREGAEVVTVSADSLELAGGEPVPFSACVWTAGFRAGPLAASAGLDIDATGRIVVDAALRSVSHPSIVAIGDAAAIRQRWGEMHGTCQSGIPTAAHAADTISRMARGRPPKPFRFGYVHQPVSLGRHDAVIQFTRADDSPRRWYLRGGAAVRYKELVSSSPPAAFRISRRLTIPRAMLSARGGRATRRVAAV